MIKGVFLSVAASSLFGFIYYYVTLLYPLNGLELLGWRMLMTVPIVSAFIIFSHEWHLVRHVWHRIKRTPYLMLIIIINATITAIQFWIFMWAPINGKGLEVSLGYLLIPLAMACIGYFGYHEHLSTLKKSAIIFAFIGVTNQILYLGHIAWETLVVALGYPFYYYLRRRFYLSHIGSFWYEMMLILPVAIYFIITQTANWAALTTPHYLLLILGLGLISGIAWIFNLAANKILPFSLFGLLSYLEPILLVVVSLLLGERIHYREIPTYCCLGLAITLLIWEGLRFTLQRWRVHSLLVNTSTLEISRKDDE